MRWGIVRSRQSTVHSRQAEIDDNAGRDESAKLRGRVLPKDSQTPKNDSSVGRGRVGVGEELQQFRAEFGRYVSEILCRELVQKNGMRVVVLSIFSGRSSGAHIEIIIGQLQMPFAVIFQEFAITVHGGVKAGLEH